MQCSAALVPLLTATPIGFAAFGVEAVASAGFAGSSVLRAASLYSTRALPYTFPSTPLSLS